MTNTTFAVGGDIEVRRLGFGAMRITGPGIWGPPRDRAAARALLRRAVDLGVQLIDTADAYGPGVSEELIAEALFPYDGLLIATKGGYERTGPSGESATGELIGWTPNPAATRFLASASGGVAAGGTSGCRDGIDPAEHARASQALPGQNPGAVSDRGRGVRRGERAPILAPELY
jgi:aryl-alcohol dehydrogenase-like predicted oxidoreductase